MHFYFTSHRLQREFYSTIMSPKLNFLPVFPFWALCNWTEPIKIIFTNINRENANNYTKNTISLLEKLEILNFKTMRLFQVENPKIKILYNSTVTITTAYSFTFAGLLWVKFSFFGYFNLHLVCLIQFSVDFPQVKECCIGRIPCPYRSKGRLHSAACNCQGLRQPVHLHLDGKRLKIRKMLLTMYPLGYKS